MRFFESQRKILQHRIVRAGAVAGAVLVTILIWDWLSYAPLIWTALLWIGVLVVYYFHSGKNATKTTILLSIALLAAITFVEATLWILDSYEARQFAREFDGNRTKYKGFYEKSYESINSFLVIPDQLGFRPKPGIIPDAAKFDGETVYDVQYTIGTNGLRVSPPVKANRNGCVLFFGDSFMFGNGISDQETAPYQLGIISGGSYTVYNFAFIGYSAHQMLTQIQSKIVKKTVACDAEKPVYAIVQVLPNNIARVRGIPPRFIIGPRYLLAKSGTIERRGNLDEGDFIAHDAIYVGNAMLPYFRRIQLYNRTFEHRNYNSVGVSNDFETERFVAIVAESRKALQAQFSGVKFLVVVWDDFLDIDGKMTLKRQLLIEALARRGLDARGIETILPEYNKNPYHYCIDHQVHPTAEAHTLFATYLLRHFLSSGLDAE